jgi:hypothetical protein
MQNAEVGEYKASDRTPYPNIPPILENKDADIIPTLQGWGF